MGQYLDNENTVFLRLPAINLQLQFLVYCPGAKRELVLCNAMMKLQFSSELFEF